MKSAIQFRVFLLVSAFAFTAAAPEFSSQPSTAKSATHSPTSAVEFLRDFTIIAPAKAGVTARIIVPPVSDATLDRIGPSATLFSIGPGDSVWLGMEPDLLIHATRGYRFRLGIPIADIAVLDNSTLLVATADAFGFLAMDEPGATSSSSQATVAFQPIITLPVTEARISLGENGTLYIFGTDVKSGRNDVFLLRPESVGSESVRALRAMRKVFSTTERISAVAGDGEETFVATGRLVVKISGGQERMTTAFQHPKEEITGLAFSRAHGLFYSTPSGVGVAWPDESIEFVRAPNVAIRLVGNSLYIFLKNNFGVVKVDGTDAFLPFLHPGKIAPLTEKGKP